MKKWSLYVINEHFEEILCLKVAIIADSLQGRERLCLILLVLQTITFIRFNVN